MDAKKLKQSLISRINESDDLDLLEALDALLYTDEKETVIELSGEQIKEISKARKDIEEGSFIENSTLEKEVKTWLKGR